MTDCVVCARPNRVDTAQVCHPCTRRLQASLERAADLAGELETTIARQGRSGDRGGRVAGAEPPLPVDLGAADSAWAVNNTITTWARHVAEERGLTVTGTDPDPTVLAARWLTGQLDWLRHRPEAAEAWDELTDACRLLEHAVDRAAPRWYAGPCTSCGADLHARAGAHTVICRTCGARHATPERREWLLSEAADWLMHAEWIAHALTSLTGDTITPARVRGLARHGRITAHSADPRGRPLYRLGDVREAVAQQDQRRHDREARRATRSVTQDIADRRSPGSCPACGAPGWTDLIDIGNGLMAPGLSACTRPGCRHCPQPPRREITAFGVAWREYEHLDVADTP